MDLLCKYYSNQARLCNSVQYLSSQPSFRFFSVSGMMVKTKKGFEVITDKVTVVVACVLPNTGKNSMMLMTSDPDLRDKNDTMVDMSTVEHDTIFYNLCVLLQEKFKTSQNDATIEFGGDKVAVFVSVSAESKGELQCLVRGMSGDMVVSGQQNIRDMLSRCHLFRSFRYVTTTDDFQKEVTVRRSRAEILKEVSRYLSRTLVIVSFLPNGDMLEQYVAANGMLEVVTHPNGTRVYRKATGSKLRDANAFCIYQSMLSIDDVVREQGRALRTEKKG